MKDNLRFSILPRISLSLSKDQPKPLEVDHLFPVLKMQKYFVDNEDHDRILNQNAS